MAITLNSLWRWGVQGVTLFVPSTAWEVKNTGGREGARGVGKGPGRAHTQDSNVAYWPHLGRLYNHTSSPGMQVGKPTAWGCFSLVGLWMENAPALFQW